MKYRYRVHPIDYALGENEKFYSDMEAKGWRVVKRGIYLSKFAPAEPGKVRYRFEVVTPGFAEDGCTMPPEQRAVYEDCGWEYVLGRDLLHLFRAPEGSDAPEFYVDPAGQLPTIEALRNQNWWGWLPIAAVIISRPSGLRGSPYAWYMYWVEQPASIGLYVLLMLWILYLWLRQNWYIRRTCRRLKSGVPLDHNPQERHTAHSVICGTILTLAVLCGVLMAVQAVGSREQPLPEQSDGPYLLMGDLGREHQVSSANHIHRTRTLLADWWEVWDSSDGQAGAWMWQNVYRLRSPGMAASFAAALRNTRNTRLTPTSDEYYFYAIGDLNAWIYQYSHELVAVSGPLAAYIHYGSSQDPEELLAVLSDRWTAYTEEGEK